MRVGWGTDLLAFLRRVKEGENEGFDRESAREFIGGF